MRRGNMLARPDVPPVAQGVLVPIRPPAYTGPGREFPLCGKGFTVAMKSTGLNDLPEPPTVAGVFALDIHRR